MKKEEKPDRMEQRNEEARARGLSYGKYVALLHEEEKREGVRLRQIGFCPEGMQPCRACGKPFPKGRIKFCCDKCRVSYQTEREHLRSVKYAAKEKALRKQRKQMQMEGGKEDGGIH